MDPEVKRYFIKILNSFSYGLIWLIFTSTFAFYFGWGIIRNGIRPGNVIFYAFTVITFLLLLRFYYRTWKDEVPDS